MTGYSPMNLAGNQQINSMFTIDSTARNMPGELMEAQDPYWGGGAFIYAKYGGTVRQFGLCVLTPAVSSGAYAFSMTEAPNTANLGRSLYVAMVGGSSGNYGWFQYMGITPVNCQASVAADTTFGIAAAGQGGANAAGKQILGGRVVVASTATVVKTNASGNSGSYQIQVADSNGWFIGAYMSGTGIASGATITSIDPSGRFVTLSAVNTALVTGSVTATYNNGTVYYNVAAINSPIAQGAIT